MTLEAIATLTDALARYEAEMTTKAQCRVELIQEAHAVGFSLSEIAAHIGISRQRVGQLLERANT